MDSDLHELIERCRTQEPRAWSQLVDRFAGLVYAIARAHRLPEDACDDVAQVVFANLARSLQSIRDPQALASWLSTTARRECWRLIKARQRQRSSLEDSPEVAVAPADQELERIDAAHRVRLGLERLGERCRELLSALFGRGTVDYQVLGARLGIPVGSIGPTRQRCLAKLAEILDQSAGSRTL